MEKNHKRKCEFQLPEEIIQQIQSLMPQKYAAQTTLISKQWQGAWSTRPDLNFDQDVIRKKEFEVFTKKTMQSYEDRSLNIHSLSLRIKRYKDYSLTAKLILKAIKLGATEIEIQLSTSTRKTFVLPDLAFQSETLTRLSVCGSRIGLQRRRKKEVITTCSNLKSLKLSSMYYVDENLIRDLILRCPLIEELTLENLWHHVDIAELIKLHKLKYLRLDRLDIGDSLSRSDLWPKFACLKELVLILDCFSNYDHRDVRICSTSLERVTILSRRIIDSNVEFDVPNIKMFKFDGVVLPRVKASSGKWEADVHINYVLCSNAKASWFSSLNQLVKMLERHRVSLSIYLSCRPGDGDGYVGDGLHIPALENLTISGLCKMSPGFLEALLWSCHPNFLSIERCCVFYKEKVNLEGFPKLLSLRGRRCSMPSRSDRKFIHFRLK